jgi:hypothetical protein
MIKLFRVFGFLIKASIDKYGAALFALISFFVQGSSAISAASAIISKSAAFQSPSGCRRYQ